MHSYFNELNRERELREMSQPLIKPFARSLKNSKFLADRIHEDPPGYTAYFTLDKKCERVVGAAVSYVQKKIRVVPSISISYDAILSLSYSEVDRTLIGRVKELAQDGEVVVIHDEDSEGILSDDDTVLSVTYGHVPPRSQTTLREIAKSIGKIDLVIAAYLSRHPIPSDMHELVRVFDEMTDMMPWQSRRLR